MNTIMYLKQRKLRSNTSATGYVARITFRHPVRWISRGRTRTYHASFWVIWRPECGPSASGHPAEANSSLKYIIFYHEEWLTFTPPTNPSYTYKKSYRKRNVIQQLAGPARVYVQQRRSGSTWESCENTSNLGLPQSLWVYMYG